MDFVLTNGGKNSHRSTKKMVVTGALQMVVTGALQMVGKIPTAQQRKFPQLPCFSESCQQLPFSVVHWVSRRKHLCKCCTKDSWWKVGGGGHPPYFNYWHDRIVKELLTKLYFLCPLSIVGVCPILLTNAAFFLSWRFPSNGSSLDQCGELRYPAQISIHRKWRYRTDSTLNW